MKLELERKSSCLMKRLVKSKLSYFLRAERQRCLAAATLLLCKTVKTKVGNGSDETAVCITLSSSARVVKWLTDDSTYGAELAASELRTEPGDH